MKKEEVKADEERPSRKTKVSTERNARVERGGGTQKETEEKRRLVLLIKRFRGDASGLITRQGRASVKGLVGGSPVVNCVAGAYTFL